MRILIINRQERARSLDTMYNRVVELNPGSQMIKLSKEQIRVLPKTLKELDVSGFDRVLFDIPLRRVAHAFVRVRALPGLVYYEEDAYQEFMGESKFHSKFLTFFKSLNGSPVIFTSASVRDYFGSRGVSAHFVAKAFDDAHLHNLNGPRDIDLAFVGRVNNQVYSRRKELLDRVAASTPLQLLRTESPDEYLAVLNRIKFFLSADIGFNEYMAKNFEAMACGCILLAKRQPTEDALLGLVDMVNVVHYDTVEELLEKYTHLLAHPDEAAAIAKAGHDLVFERHRLSQRAEEFSAVLALPHQNPQGVHPSGLFHRLRALITGA